MKVCLGLEWQQNFKWQKESRTLASAEPNSTKAMPLSSPVSRSVGSRTCTSEQGQRCASCRQACMPC